MNKLPELQNRDLKKLEQKFDIGNAELLSDRVSQLKRMKVLRKTDHWADWMGNWVYWDSETREYVGSAPDNYIIARNQFPDIFLLQYKEASLEWQRQEKLIQDGL